MSVTPAIAVESVRFAHAGGAGMAFDLAIPAASRIAVIGPSGSGKSTLLHLIAGFERPSSGRIFFSGREMTQAEPADRPVTTLFQDNNLFEHLTIAQNAGLGLAPRLRLTADEKRRIDAMLAAVGLSGMGGRLPGALSGGERQRAALARALLSGKPVLLLDEPFAALGPALRDEMLTLVTDAQQARGLTVLMVTHSPADARAFATHVLFVDHGRGSGLLPVTALDAPEAGSALAAYLGR
ncbi:MAG: ATP-binding cassette domain-containing protein [Rhizobiaceae bacterium]|jgi:thiamine transport system ATP-binding protein|nr:ATP-binding cassette domain-containing protein [Rhizobiaceae bacterium]